MLETRIPVVEDERARASFIEQGLRAEGHAVTVCHDGEGGEAAALTRLRDRAARPALPGKTGLDMLGAIRANAGTGQ